MVASGGVGTDIPPALTLLDGDGKILATFPLEATSHEERLLALVSTAKIIEWTDAAMCVLAMDTYVARQVEGAPWPIDPEPDAAKRDLERLHRARDPRVFEAITVIAMHDSKAEWMGTRPYHYEDGKLQWIMEDLAPDEPEDGDGGPAGGNFCVALRAGFETRVKRQLAGVPALSPMQAGYVLGMNTVLLPEDD